MTDIDIMFPSGFTARDLERVIGILGKNLPGLDGIWNRWDSQGLYIEDPEGLTPNVRKALRDDIDGAEWDVKPFLSFRGDSDGC